MTDSHCHVFFSKFEEDRDQVLTRAYEYGVTRMIQVNCDEREQEPLLQAIRDYQTPVQLYGTIGLHPTHFVPGADCSEEEQQRLWSFWEKLCKEYPEQIVAVGETGFDFFHEYSKEAQEVYFRLQLDFARAQQLPVVLHIRDAFPDTFRVLEEYTELPMVFHCFTGGLQEMEYILEHFPQAYISFSGVVTYPKSDELRLVAEQVPEDRFLVETDCPFLAPQQVRGQRNEPYFVTHTARSIAEYRGVDYEVLEQITDANCNRLFPRLSA